MEPGKIFYVFCPNCAFRYYASRELLELEGKPTICPKCHHEFSLENVSIPAGPTPGWKLFER